MDLAFIFQPKSNGFFIVPPLLFVSRALEAPKTLPRDHLEVKTRRTYVKHVPRGLTEAIWDSILVPKSLPRGIQDPLKRLPQGPQKASKLAQVATKCLTILSPALALLVTYFQGHFRSAPWHHFGRFREPRGPKIMDFRMIFRHISIRF